MNTPTMGATGLTVAGPGPGSENRFDIYYPNGTYNGSWWFGSTNWASWSQALYGPRASASGMTYFGAGAAGNDAGLMTYGDWASTSGVDFILTKHGFDAPGYLLASLQTKNQYMPPPYDATRLVGGLGGNTPWLMIDNVPGDFCEYHLTVPAQYMNATVYFQGALTDMSPVVPIDMSNGVRSN